MIIHIELNCVKVKLCAQIIEYFFWKCKESYLAYIVVLSYTWLRSSNRYKMCKIPTNMFGSEKSFVCSKLNKIS